MIFDVFSLYFSTLENKKKLAYERLNFKTQSKIEFYACIPDIKKCLIIYLKGEGGGRGLGKKC